MKSIIHFTRSFNSLLSIIKSSSLKLFYCKEDFYLGDRVISSAVHPMVSFSEHLIGSLEGKKITYGQYGIAFKRTWIRKHKIHPVLYVDKNSHIAKSLANLLRARRKRATIQLAPHVRLSIMTIKCFTKNSIGFNSYFEIDKFNFKREQEWRYVPTKKQIGNKLISQTKRKYIAQPEFYDRQLEPYPLTFSYDDIEYIFVANTKQQTEISEINSSIKSLVKISTWTYERKKKA